MITTATKVFRCALYVRVSTDRQVDPEGSIKSQTQRLREELEYRSRRSQGEEDWQEAGYFMDEAKSGSTTEGRHEFLRLMAGVMQGKFDVVMALEISRVSRSVVDFSDFLETLRKHQCQFVAVTQPIDTTSLHGDMIAKILVCLSEFERKMTGMRTRDTMKVRAKRGLFNGGQIPFGYKSDPEQKGRLIIVEDQAALVREMFEKYLELGSYARVAKWLNETGRVRPAFQTTRKRVHKATPWTISHLQGLLTSKTYIGIRVVEGGQTRKGKSSKSADSQEITAAWPAIISNELFEQVQASTIKNGRSGYCPLVDRSHTYLLSGILRCAHCDVAFVGSYGVNSMGKPYYYYNHPKGTRKDDCPLPKSIRADRIDDLTLERMDVLSTQPDVLEAILRKAEREGEDSIPALQQRLATRRKEVVTIKAEAEGILGSLSSLNGGAGVEFVKSKLDDLSQRKAKVEEDVAVLEGRLQQAQAATFNCQEIMLMLRNVRAVLGELPPHQRKELVGLVIQRATLSNDQLRFDMLGGQQWVAKVAANTAFSGQPGRPKKDGPSKVFGWPVRWLPSVDTCQSR